MLRCWSAEGLKTLVGASFKASEITALAHDRETGGDVLVFDPTRVPDGIRLTEDRILLARSGAYSVSVTRRVSG